MEQKSGKRQVKNYKEAEELRVKCKRTSSKKYVSTPDFDDAIQIVK